MNAYTLSLFYKPEIIRVPIFAQDDESALHKAKRTMRIFPKKKLLCFDLCIIEETEMRGVVING